MAPMWRLGFSASDTKLILYVGSTSTPIDTSKLTGEVRSPSCVATPDHDIHTAITRAVIDQETTNGRSNRSQN